MGRGILTGLIWGLVVGGGILTVANEIVGPVEVSVPMPKAVDDAAPESVETAPAEVDAPQMSAAQPAAEPDRSGAQPDEPAADMAGDVIAETETDAAAPVPQPDMELPDTPNAPDGEALAVPHMADETPVLPTPQAQEPQVEGTATAPNTEPQVTPETQPELAEVPEGTDTAPTQPQMPGAASDTMLGESAEATLGNKVGSFTDREDTRLSTRLPSVAPQTDAEEPPVIMADDLPALVAYSADFNGKVEGPMMSVILVDVAQLGPDDAAIAKLPFPVTFGVDVLAPAAGERALSYREKGLEVLAMVGLPEGATPQDAAQTLTQAEEIMPVSVGFLDVPSASYQASRQIAAQVVAAAAVNGRGLVSFPRGLNSLEQEAKREDQPVALVFRDIDGRDQDVAAIKRFLDQAAFRAGIDNGIVLLGRSTPQTIQALAEWALGNRAATVSLVPLSYQLTANADQN
ncbi:divergent polysaccharide deacetylase family protein [Celeribacter sp.]|uniref:divergent polysaccharide deacetylase family protein n=1 Tax=Celeribacter sp. TaxID=1890673 RepID=UPI003A8F3614